MRTFWVVLFFILPLVAYSEATREPVANETKAEGMPSEAELYKEIDFKIHLKDADGDADCPDDPKSKLSAILDKDNVTVTFDACTNSLVEAKLVVKAEGQQNITIQYNGNDIFGSPHNVTGKVSEVPCTPALLHRFSVENGIADLICEDAKFYYTFPKGNVEAGKKHTVTVKSQLDTNTNRPLQGECEIELLQAPDVAKTAIVNLPSSVEPNDEHTFTVDLKASNEASIDCHEHTKNLFTTSLHPTTGTVSLSCNADHKLEGKVAVQEEGNYTVGIQFMGHDIMGSPSTVQSELIIDPSKTHAHWPHAQRFRPKSNINIPIAGINHNGQQIACDDHDQRRQHFHMTVKRKEKLVTEATGTKCMSADFLAVVQVPKAGKYDFAIFFDGHPIGNAQQVITVSNFGPNYTAYILLFLFIFGGVAVGIVVYCVCRRKNRAETQRQNRLREMADEWQNDPEV
eukprot:gnl/Trimastix_PCT/3397.p1 GENE.gnl/Trimastix_PCT/3397~~gnl/Trimastix_PCT/3397.p1  ORF type:complete len:457 (-),score=105.90 gnl/Trimastix_PCT/3397:49-1419(-)